MTESTSDDKTAAKKSQDLLTEVQVLEYLKSHPKLLLNNPKLLSDLTPDRRFDSETVVDMQRFVVQRLRRQVDELKASSAHLVTTTRSNMSILGKTHDCALAILGVKDFQALGRFLAEEVPLYLGVDAAAIGIEVNPQDEGVPPGVDSALRILTPGTVDMLVGSGEPKRLRTKADGGTALYGAAEGLVASDALVRLEPMGNMPLGVFAVGSRDEGYFSFDQGTELLGFLAEVVRYAVARWWPDQS
ncbi:MAG: DUF484 family protein [Rhodospirillaceae bacterium]